MNRVGDYFLRAGGGIGEVSRSARKGIPAARFKTKKSEKSSNQKKFSQAHRENKNRGEKGE